MDKKMLAIVAVAIVALAVAVVSLAFVFTVISANHPNPSSATATPAPTSIPTSTNPTSPSTPTNKLSTTPPEVTASFSPKVTFSPVSNNATVAPLMYLNTTTHIASGTYAFNINVNNPASSAASPQPCNIQIVFTETDKNNALPTDATLNILTQGRDPLYGEPTVMYSFYTQINATAYGNMITYLFAPAGNYWEPYIDYLSPNGFTVTSGYNETFSMKIVLNQSFGQYNLAINVVPTT